jgi:AcrR family transcriptional regulator
VASGKRDRILVALRDLLSSGGTAAVTLEAVAAAAGVSKGGLLYHFPSKSALYIGLLEAVRDRVAADMAASSAAVGAARAYLQYAIPADDAEAGFFTSLIAAVRTESDNDDRATALLADIFRAWEAPMRAAVQDPVQAEMLRLVGNGVYLSAIAGLPPTSPDVLAAIFDRLLTQASVPSGVQAAPQHLKGS